MSQDDFCEQQPSDLPANPFALEAQEVLHKHGAA